MTLGVAAVVVRTPFEDFTVQVRRGGPRPEGEQLELARWAASQFRFGIDMGDPGVVRAARELVRLLDGDGSGFGFGRGPGNDDGFGSSRRDAFSTFGNAFGGIAARLEEELLAGRLVVERQRFAPLTERRDLFDPELPPLPPPRRESKTHTFEVRFVDEVGTAISGIDAEFTADGAQTRPTNAAGIALLEGVQSSSATVSLLDSDALSKVLDPRWETFRLGKPPKESNTTQVLFRGGELGPFPLKAELPNTVVIKPPLGRLHVELWDKTGRVRHINCPYTISGPTALAGTTDERGRLLHDDVFPGDYELSFTREFFEGKDKQTDTYRSPLVVLAPEQAEPKRRLLGAVPLCVLARLHMFFNTNKTFLLPTALPSVRALRKLYLTRAPCELLVVGHADTAGDAAYNDKLSLERAEATIAYLNDDVEGWFKFYDQGVEQKKRWGKVEDRLMIVTMPNFETKPPGEDAVRWFQRTRSLEVDGEAGKDTRRKLIAEYMSLDGASLSEFDVEIVATAHGCGEHFPLEETGRALDDEPTDETPDPGDRRVELFFFDPEFGIVPKPPTKSSKAGSPEYPAWLKAASEAIDLEASGLLGPEVTFVEFDDARFRTNSCVVLPEGEQPDAKVHKSLSSASLVATLLRFNEAQLTPKKLFIAGHTDTTASPEFNQPLSEERAQCVLACVTGDREAFKNLCDARHTVGDYKQILSWVTKAFGDRPLGEGGFDCDPGKIDDNAATGKKAVEAFQTQYNLNKAALGLSAANPDLGVDGDVGPLTWGGIFDVYELALREELGEEPGLQELRAQLRFVDDQNKALGFSEHHPIDGLGEDSFRSQSNRRVEALFFAPGEEPDLALAKEDPASSELYVPGKYVRSKVSSQINPREPVLKLQILDARRRPMPGATYLLTVSDAQLPGVTDAEGFLVERVPEGAEGAELTVQETTTINLVFRRLDGSETPKGAQDRLSNLGLLHHAAAAGDDNEDFRRLVAGAQDSIDNLEVTGELDEPTKKELARQHLS